MTDLSAKLDEIAMHYHDMTGDNYTVPWEKCSSRYRTQVRKMVRNVINCQAIAQQALRTTEAGDVVKGLEWVKHDSVAHIANTIVGPYIAEPCGSGEYRAWLPDDKKLATRMMRGFYSLEAAKAAAQADFEARILSALEHQP